MTLFCRYYPKHPDISLGYTSTWHQLNQSFLFYITSWMSSLYDPELARFLLETPDEVFRTRSWAWICMCITTTADVFKFYKAFVEMCWPLPEERGWHMCLPNRDPMSMRATDSLWRWIFTDSIGGIRLRTNATIQKTELRKPELISNPLLFLAHLGRA